MDKRICYVKAGCCICDPAVVSKDFVPCEGCQEYALVSPSDLTALESQCALKDEYARIGEAVVEWANSAKPPTGSNVPAAVGYGMAIHKVRDVIAQAREGEKA